MALLFLKWLDQARSGKLLPEYQQAFANKRDIYIQKVSLRCLHGANCTSKEMES